MPKKTSGIDDPQVEHGSNLALGDAARRRRKHIMERIVAYERENRVELTDRELIAILRNPEPGSRDAQVAKSKLVSYGPKSRAWKYRLKKEAERLMRTEMQRLFGKSTKILEAELDSETPDLDVAMFVVREALKFERGQVLTYLPDDAQMQAKVRTMEDVAGLAAELLERMMDGRLPLEHAEKIQDIVSRHAQILGATTLDDLRERFEKVIEQVELGSGPTSAGGPTASFPQWGKAAREARERGDQGDG